MYQLNQVLTFWLGQQIMYQVTLTGRKHVYGGGNTQKHLRKMRKNDTACGVHSSFFQRAVSFRQSILMDQSSDTFNKLQPCKLHFCLWITVVNMPWAWLARLELELWKGVGTINLFGHKMHCKPTLATEIFFWQSMTPIVGTWLWGKLLCVTMSRRKSPHQIGDWATGALVRTGCCISRGFSGKTTRPWSLVHLASLSESLKR